MVVTNGFTQTQANTTPLLNTPIAEESHVIITMPLTPANSMHACTISAAETPSSCITTTSWPPSVISESQPSNLPDVFLETVKFQQIYDDLLQKNSQWPQLARYFGYLRLARPNLQYASKEEQIKTLLLSIKENAKDKGCWDHYLVNVQDNLDKETVGDWNRLALTLIGSTERKNMETMLSQIKELKQEYSQVKQEKNPLTKQRLLEDMVNKDRVAFTSQARLKFVGLEPLFRDEQTVYTDMGPAAKVLRNFPQCTTLRVEGQSLSCLPAEFAHLQGLKTLIVGDNRLSEIPPNELVKIEHFNGSNNRFMVFPSIGNWTKLRALFLSKNQISEIPEFVKKFTQLQVLDLSQNTIQTIADNILPGLENVTKLKLEGNQIKTLPSDIAQMRKLEKLNLAQNQFEEFPEVLKQLPKLKKVNLQGNPGINQGENKQFLKELRGILESRKGELITE